MTLGGAPIPKPGTDGMFPNTQGSKLNLPCLRSWAGFGGRPPFCGAKVLSVDSSKSRTNSSVPNGRPVCVLCRIERISDSVSPASRYSFQLETSHCSLHGSMVSNPSPAAAPAGGPGPGDLSQPMMRVPPVPRFWGPGRVATFLSPTGSQMVYRRRR